jgi:spore coat protein A, manganese oxidase
MTRLEVVIMPTRRVFIKWGALVGVGALAVTGGALIIPRFLQSSDTAQTPLLGSRIPKFVDPLPTFAGARVTSQSFTVQMEEFQQKILPDSLYSGLSDHFKAGTYLWGYKVGDQSLSYPGHTIEAQRGTPTDIRYLNKIPLPSVSKLQSHLTIDETLHWSAPHGHHTDSTEAYQGSIPTSVHLHGAEVASSFDGGPEQWFTSDGLHGKGYVTFASTGADAAIYHYPNSQPATTLWFHDHALGITRLNIFSGLVACYVVRDQYDTGRPDNPLGLPAGPQEVELIIQDRQFDDNGQMLFLNDTPPNPSIHPHWMPEFFGDTIVVNGKSWPYLDVEPRRYRFRMVNGSNARFYSMHLVDSSSKETGPAFWQIGTDGGLLDAPVKLNDPRNASSLRLILAPGERADIIIDFANYTARSFILVNDAPSPYPDGDTPANPESHGTIMQFRVKKPLLGQDTTYDPASGGSLRGGSKQEAVLTRLVDVGTGTLASGVTASVKRQLTLVEIAGPDGPVGALLNNTKWKGSREGTNQLVSDSQPDKQGQGIYLTELPRVGSTEVWEIINLTEDAHPIHIHLVQFQLINRQKFDPEKYRAKYDSLFPGGTYAGVTSQKTWGQTTYKSGEYIPGYGPPLPYSSPNESGAIGGNPDVTPYLQEEKILPDANEAGWKDTLKVYPKQVTRIAIRWAPISTPVDGVVPGQNLYPFDPTSGPGYVWHCHILDHEDNEMMRPYAPVM